MERIGLVNMYLCRSCSREWRTVNLNTGVTPFIVRCPKCGGECHSTMYKALFKGSDPVTHCFYRPTKAEYDGPNLFSREHVRNGGLLFAELGHVTPMVEKGPWVESEAGEHPSAVFRKFLDDTFPKRPPAEPPAQPEVPEDGNEEGSVPDVRGAESHPGDGAPEEPQDSQRGDPLREDAGQKDRSKQGRKRGPRNAPGEDA